MKRSMKEWIKENLWNAAFKKFQVMWSVETPYFFKVFKDYIPYILFGPFLNDLFHIFLIKNRPAKASI